MGSCVKPGKERQRNNFPDNNNINNKNPSLIGFKESEKLKILNPLLQCLIHIKSLVEYFKKKICENKNASILFIISQQWKMPL